MKGLVIVPTYKESANICRLLDELLRQGLELEILVVDDNSPDGTADLVRAYSKKDARVRVMVRTGQRGRGAAGIDGFREAVASRADYVVEMDAYFSHDPAFLPRFLPALENADVVIASRRVPGGSEPGRSVVRKVITKLASAWIRLWLRLPVHDPTAGFRCFRRSALAKVDWDKLQSVGPSIVEEVLWALHRAGARIVEIPLVFQPRAAGESQLSFRKLLDTYWRVTCMPFRRPPIHSSELPLM